MSQAKQEATIAGKFLSVGALNTIIDFALLNLFVWLGMNSYLAASLSFLAATTNSYVWNRSWTFSHIEKRPIASQFSLFLLSNLFGLAINTTLQYQFIQWFQDHSLVVLNAAKLVAVGLVVLWNYASSRFLIFRPGK